ncbi:MAG TPA: FAD-dependent oxidoreductase [Thermoanaerobaculia bacterium]|nr:FAD-dependent oxidoreductase [Thermoanaerobaculia bacterium]
MHNDLAFPTLSDEQIDRLRVHGEEEETSAGDYLFRQGDESYDFYVLLAGEAEIVEEVDEDADGECEERVLAAHGAGRFLGEMNLLTGQAVYLSARVSEAGAVLRLDREALRQVIADDPELSELILNAFLARRTILLEGNVSGLRLLGSRYSRDTARLREFALRNRLPHTWVDLEDDPEGEALLRGFGLSPCDTPLVVWGKTVLKNPSNAELAQAVGLDTARISGFLYDLLVVGAGPAGLAAAVYAASEGLRTVALDSVAVGGQAGTSSRIENYLGFPAGLSGAELASRAAVQAEKFGALLSVPRTAVALSCEAIGDGGLTPGCIHVVELDDGSTVEARAVVVATGARYRRLEVDRREEMEGTSIFYAATEMEGEVCRDCDAVVVGGGNSAGQACLFLAERASRVYLVVRGDDLGESMSRYLVERIESSERIEVLVRTEVRELLGDGVVEAVVVEDGESGERRELACKGLFTFIGAEPHTEWLQGTLALDGEGFVKTGPQLGNGHWQRGDRAPHLLETSLPGVFAAGDVRSGAVKRVASAVGEGSIAVKFVHEYLARG